MAGRDMIIGGRVVSTNLQPSGSQIPFGTDSFADNPEPRVPCVLLLDVSYSMVNEPIRQLNEALVYFAEDLKKDSLARKRAETAIVTFGDAVQIVQDFATASSLQVPRLQASGLTPMGRAVHTGLDMLDKRKAEYKTNGVPYYRPWVFLISDGAPNDEGWEAAAQRAKTGDANKSYAFFPVGVEGADLSILSLFSARKPKMLKGLMFHEMFAWLSSSLKSVSRSTPGDELRLESTDGWSIL